MVEQSILRCLVFAYSSIMEHQEGFALGVSCAGESDLEAVLKNDCLRSSVLDSEAI